MSIHARCFHVTQTPEGRDVACQRSKGHDPDKPKRERVHRTPDDGGWVWVGDGTATREGEASVPLRTIYVVTHGRFVVAADFDEDEARKAALDVLSHVEITEHEWRPSHPGGTDREELFYKPARSGRWNNSDVVLTRTTVSDPKGVTQ